MFIGGLIETVYVLCDDAKNQINWPIHLHESYQLAECVSSAKTITEACMLVRQYMEKHTPQDLNYLCSDLLDFLNDLSISKVVDNYSMIQYAVSTHCLDALHYILDRHQVDTGPLLCSVIERDNSVCLEHLLDRGIAPKLSDEDCVHFLMAGCFWTMELLWHRHRLNHVQTSILLTFACARGALELVRQMIPTISISKNGVLNNTENWVHYVNVWEEEWKCAVLDHSWRIEFPSWLFRPCVMGAIENGHLDMVDLLQEQGEDWKAGMCDVVFDLFLVVSAIRSGDRRVMERVRTAFASSMEWASHMLMNYFCHYHQDSLFDWSLDNGASWTKPDVDFGLFNLTLRMVERQSDLEARRCGFRMMRKLLQLGASVSERHDLMFSFAINQNDEEVLRFLLQHGTPSTCPTWIHWEYRARESTVGRVFREYLPDV